MGIKNIRRLIATTALLLSVPALTGCQELTEVDSAAAKSERGQADQANAAAKACEWTKPQLSEENCATYQHVFDSCAGDFITGGTGAIGTAAATNEAPYAETGFATPKPVGLSETIILASTRPGETVLDAYGGSLTTAVAAMNTGRKVVNNQIDPEIVCDSGLVRCGPVDLQVATGVTAMAAGPAEAVIEPIPVIEFDEDLEDLIAIRSDHPSQPGPVPV